MIDRKNTLPVTRQCQLLLLSRLTAYYWLKDISNGDLAIMKSTVNGGKPKVFVTELISFLLWFFTLSN